MAILSPIMNFIVDREVGFPTPSEKEKLSTALRRYRYLLSQHPKRSDAPEIMFGIADLLVGQGNPGDHLEAMKLYDQILLRNIPEYLKGRAIIGKAELLIGQPEEFDNAISLCDQARKLLGKDVSDFFAAKTFVVEAELLLARGHKGDWAQALGLINKIVNEKDVHWYFKGRALLAKSEMLLYRSPEDLGASLKLCNFALVQLKNRPDDYFTNKGEVLRGEILIRRANLGDFKRAQDCFSQVIKMSLAFQDLLVRAKLDLADLVPTVKAEKLIQEVKLMGELPSYLSEKAKILAEAVKNKTTLRSTAAAKMKAKKQAQKIARKGKRKKRK
ncbi:hypothetical protein COT42_02325 [Candidatus Saganbacteria bacterium CG08_land_8_20_14_0_20_45_16]|uniref:Tetratricopeptide repeat-like domain-containing protein n=1 Tax=Candidatus Saganbacteria bacterium CG08_land_8_20_14_0_20_45_16 TaxID=2014293 RepID=A0A2H0Y294_UNCSA|nr:MAG: hypothetical protein COT42_02325 [Candidatus Saganbacteria bacterium CG08_land_8_20_14_0_20_45_16]